VDITPQLITLITKTQFTPSKTNVVEEVVTVSLERLMGYITDAHHLRRSVSRSFMDEHNPKSTQDRIRPSHASIDPLES
jgi:hypothetical protein